MLIKNLKIKNIGPFEEASIDFASDFTTPPITVITGRNGAGKSMIIDAIRAVLAGGNVIERNIVSIGKSDFEIRLEVESDTIESPLITTTTENEIIKEARYKGLAKPMRYGYDKDDTPLPFIIDYWSSSTPKGKLEIQNLVNINNLKLIQGVLNGVKNNVDLVNFICHIDYLKSSDDEEEKATGEAIFGYIKDIIKACVENGELMKVRRTDYQPIILQNGFPLTLPQISVGNLFLVEHFILLLCQYYSLSMLLKKTFEETIENVGGVLLIDEIESHLHPYWQKSILSLIRHFFPKLQIIVTTHSPFILSSLQGLKIYTAKAQEGKNFIANETDYYASMPVDEILLSDAFNTTPFNNNITGKMRERKAALQQGNTAEAERLKKELIEINPEYFGYMDIEGINDLA